MTGFQVFALLLLAFLTFLTLKNLITRKGRPRVNLIWTLLWVCSGVGIARPKWTGVVAQALGIGRGADLIFYVGILTMLAGFFYVYLRIRRMERGLTLLTRRLAITEAQLESAQASDPGHREVHTPAE